MYDKVRFMSLSQHFCEIIFFFYIARDEDIICNTETLLTRNGMCASITITSTSRD